ncbi:hypothetical protein BDY19DRAFT_163369 [Irpex rosettiformis]|uniref:Uncharacterized protein n=1 Tax=Irpex rosettiformis TaxID=378272 RepID=A0ACB8U454_9APHY|nr:hypothetical protein BDY19DRAFT_163369 [Irpex rosettiformis]
MASLPSMNIEPLVGPCFIIIWLSFILYGLVLAQVYFYFTTYEDHVLLKLAVALLCTMETLQVAACIHFVYTYLIVFFGNAGGLDIILWSIILAIFLEVFINILVQSFYITRIWRLYRNVPLLIYLLSLLVVCTVLGFRACALPALQGTWQATQASPPYQRDVIASLSLRVLFDASITLILTWIMSRQLSFAHKRSIKKIVHSLMFYGLGVGGVTTITTTITLILLLTSSTPLNYGGMIIVMSKVYANSMMALLNIRKGIKNKAFSDDRFTLELTNVPRHGGDLVQQAVRAVLQW